MLDYVMDTLNTVRTAVVNLLDKLSGRRALKRTQTALRSSHYYTQRVSLPTSLKMAESFTKEKESIIGRMTQREADAKANDEYSESIYKLLIGLLSITTAAGVLSGLAIRWSNVIWFLVIFYLIILVSLLITAVSGSRTFENINFLYMDDAIKLQNLYIQANNVRERLLESLDATDDDNEVPFEAAHTLQLLDRVLDVVEDAAITVPTELSAEEQEMELKLKKQVKEEEEQRQMKKQQKQKAKEELRQSLLGDPGSLSSKKSKETSTVSSPSKSSPSKRLATSEFTSSQVVMNGLPPEAFGRHHRVKSLLKLLLCILAVFAVLIFALHMITVKQDDWSRTHQAAPPPKARAFQV